MSRRGALVFIAAAIVLSLGLLWWTWRPQAPEAPPPETASPPPTPPVLEEVALFFPGAEGMIYGERRQMELPDDPRQRIRFLVETLLAGPGLEGLVAPLPEGVTLGAVYLHPEGIVYLDLRAEVTDPPSSGSRLEMQRLYSLVDTVLLNVEGLRGVVLLWNGIQRTTFGGHVDTTHPLLANLEILRQSP